MDAERKSLLSDLIRSAYLHPESIRAFVDMFSITASLHGREVKQGPELELAKKTIMTDKFIDAVVVDLKELSNDAIAILNLFYSCFAMEEFRKSKNLKEMTRRLNDSLFEELTKSA